MKFERWFTRVTDKFDFFLFRSVLGLLVLLIVTQVVMSNENVRYFLSVVDQREGASLDDYELDRPVVSPTDQTISDEEYYLLLEAEAEVGLTELKVIVDEDKVYNFEDNQVEIRVRKGNMVEIDGSSYDFPIRVTVREASQDIIPAMSQAMVITYGTVELLGWVITD